MKKKSRIILELKDLIQLLYQHKYFLIILFPIFYLIKLIFSKKKDDKIYLYVNNNIYREIHIAEILRKNQQVHLIYKDKPAYYLEILKINCSYSISKDFFLNFLLNPSKKIIFVADSYEVLPFLIFDRNVIISFYDSVIGRNSPAILELAEILVIKLSKYIIERDLRLHKIYKKIYKLNKIKNIYISDKFNIINNPKKLAEIHAVSLGWIDNDICKIEKTIDFLCSRKVYVHIFSSRKDLLFLCPYLKHQQDKFGKFLIIEEPIFGKKLLNKISKYHLGISPHEEYINYSEDINYGKIYLAKYYEYCPSSRIADFLSCKIINIISKKYKFNDFTIKKYGGGVIYYEELFNYKDNLKEIIKKIPNNNKYLNNFNHFDNKYKTKKFLKFLDFIKN